MATTEQPTTFLRIALTEQLMISNRQQLKLRVVDAIAAGVRDVVLDARETAYIDTSGLGVLVSLHKKCREAGGSLTIVNLTEEMRSFLEYTRLDTVLTLAPREASAP